MSPIEALERAVHLLDRSQEGGFKTKAFLRALNVARTLDPVELDRRTAAGTLTALDGIGDSTARVITEAFRNASTYLDLLEVQTRVPLSPEGARYLSSLRGDCHLHSLWSDGGATVEAMARTAAALGHEYIVLTDHSPRLTVAHGLRRERLAEQVAEVAGLRSTVAPLRLLTGIEVDILEDGTLDHDDEVLAGLDVVVASVHAKLRMDAAQMTARMVRAVSSPHVDILGHCTGRMIAKRDPSSFDADRVFAACAEFCTAVEINCRPERLDPPIELVRMAIDHGCLFTIDSDAHATGQLEWQPLGCDRAAEAGVPIERIVNTWSADEVLAWTAHRAC